MVFFFIHILHFLNLMTNLNRGEERNESTGVWPRNDFQLQHLYEQRRQEKYRWALTYSSGISCQDCDDSPVKGFAIHRSLNSFSLSFLSLVKNCNHKGLGIYYLLSAFIFGISGTLISVLIRIELYSSGNRIISPENQNFYNISITLHGFLMIFFLVMPGLFGGFGNYFVPIFQGSPEVVYPRVNNFSILILFVSYLFFILSIISEFGGGTGWTLYPPLSTSFMSLSPSSTGNLIFGLLISGISSCLTSLNFWTTILNLRSYYLTLKTMPLFPWAFTFCSLLESYQDRT